MKYIDKAAAVAAAAAAASLAKAIAPCT